MPPQAEGPRQRSPQPEGDSTPEGRKTRAGQYNPRAKASDAHVPEPLPEKHAEATFDGFNPAGQADEGNDTHTPRAVATARTQACDRAANVQRPTPNR